MRKIKIRRKSNRRHRIKRRSAPHRVTASRVRVRKPGRRKSLPKTARTLLTKPRRGRKIVLRKRRRSTAGRYAATVVKRSRREINVFGAEGYQPVADASPRQAKLSSHHLIAINRFLRTGDTKPLKQFRGRRIAAIELLANPRRIREFADAGEVKLDGLYRDQRGRGRRK
jgi:hypothetical protein